MEQVILLQQVHHKEMMEHLQQLMQVLGVVELVLQVQQEVIILVEQEEMVLLTQYQDHQCLTQEVEVEVVELVHHQHLEQQVEQVEVEEVEHQVIRLEKMEQLIQVEVEVDHKVLLPLQVI